MIQGLSPARLEYWMDLNNVLSAGELGRAARRSSRAWIGRSRCSTLANGGENNAKLMLGKKL